MQYVQAPTYKGLDIAKQLEFINTACVDIRERISALWEPNKRSIEIIQLRNSFKAFVVKCSSILSHASEQQRLSLFSDVRNYNNIVHKLELKYTGSVNSREANATLEKLAELTSTVGESFSAVRGVSNRLTTIYDTIGSNRALISGVNEGRLLMQALENLQNKIQGIQDELSSNIAKGFIPEGLSKLFTTTKESAKTDIQSASEFIKRMKKIIQQFDVRKSVLKQSSDLQKWVPRITRRIGTTRPKLAKIIDEVSTLGAEPFPDPITEIVVDLRAGNLLADVKVMLCGIIHDNVLELSKELPSACETALDALNDDTRALEAQVDDVYEALVPMIKASTRKDVTSEKVRELKMALISLKATVKQMFAIKTKTWCHKYIKQTP